jgi:ABC-type uncharacterized transport system substrate-binding protein
LSRRGVRAVIVAAAAATGLLAAAPARAHPHVFIDYRVSVLCRANRIAAVRISWTFDEMYSASLFHDYTSRPRGPLSAADIAELRKDAFQDVAENHYFTDLTLDGKPLPVTKVTDFEASYDGRKMTYRFTVPLGLAPAPGANILDIDSFDTEFYIDFALAKRNPISIEQGGALKIACAPQDVTKTTTTFGPMATRIVRCRVRGAGA